MFASTHDAVSFLQTGERFAVTFTKKNGEHRTMFGALPADAHALNEESVPFLEESGIWKSFRLDALISIEAC